MKKEREKERNTGTVKMAIKYISRITLNINGLNAPIKSHKVVEWVRKYNPHICCLQETYLRTKDLYRLKVKGWKKIF